MTLEEIKHAVASGKRVYWQHQSYEVITDDIDQYLIKCHQTGHCIGLAWMGEDQMNLNGREKDFFIGAV